MHWVLMGVTIAFAVAIGLRLAPYIWQIKKVIIKVIFFLLAGAVTIAIVMIVMFYPGDAPAWTTVVTAWTIAVAAFLIFVGTIVHYWYWAFDADYRQVFKNARTEDGD